MGIWWNGVIIGFVLHLLYSQSDQGTGLRVLSLIVQLSLEASLVSFGSINLQGKISGGNFYTALLDEETAAIREAEEWWRDI